MKLPAVKDTIMIKQDDEAIFAINLDDGEIYQLNPTALKIFNFCAQGLLMEEAVSRLAVECIEPGQEDVIRQDVQETVDFFGELEFLTEQAM
jgi:hypothetical protein